MQISSKYINTILSSDFIRNSITLISGSSIAQIISIGTAPVLYRIYSKEDYGLLGLYMAVSGVLSAFSTFQYSQVILLEKDDRDAKQALWLVRIINGTLSIIVTISIFIAGDLIGKLLENQEIKYWLYFLPISIFFSGQNEIFRVWANRKKRYKLMTKNAILTASLVPVASVSLGLLHNGPLGLFIGLVLSQFIPAILLIVNLRKTDNFGFSTIDIKEVKNIVYKYRQFPIYGFPSEFVNRLSNQLPVFFLNSFGGIASVGAYNLTVRILGLPIALISNAIGEVFKQKSTEEFYSKGNCKNIFVKTLKLLSLMVILPTLLTIIFGPWLFKVSFGSKWIEAGHLARLLIIMFSLRFIISPLSFLFYLRNKLKEDFFWHIWMLVSTVISFYLGYHFTNDVSLTILIFSINYSIIYIIYLFRSYRFSTEQ